MTSSSPPAYAIGHLTDVVVNDELLHYMETIEATMAPYGGEFLVHGTRPEVVEGEWPGDLVLIRFPHLAAARDWYRSADYQAIVGDRTRNSTTRLALLEGVPAGYSAAETVAKLSGGEGGR